MAELVMPTTPGVLLLEGNEALLRKQGHTRVGDLLMHSLSGLCQQGTLRLWRRRLNSVEDVKIAADWAKYTKYSAVVIVAHSTDSEVEAAPGYSLTWEEVGEKVAPLDPNVIMNVSCSGGSMKPTRALFERIPSLRSVVGSPVPMKSTEALIAMIEVVTRALGGQVPAEFSSLLTLLNLFATKSVVWTRTREEFERNTPLDMATQDLAAGLLKALVEGALDDSPPPRRTRRRRQLVAT
jgi:hypothetical protein